MLVKDQQIKWILLHNLFFLVSSELNSVFNVKLNSFKKKI